MLEARNRNRVIQLSKDATTDDRVLDNSLGEILVT